MISKQEYDQWERRHLNRLLRAKSAHMSNTKWQEVFNLLREAGVGTVTIKWVDVEEPRSIPVPLAEEMQAKTFGCFHPWFYYADIDWLEIELGSAPGSLEDDLRNLGRLPITVAGGQVRLTAYTW